MRSFVHDYLDREPLSGEFDDNHPRGVRCVHPLVTVLEKLDALHRRVPRQSIEPAAFFYEVGSGIGHQLGMTDLGLEGLAYDAISPRFWGPRVPLDAACRTIRDWISVRIGPLEGV